MTVKIHIIGEYWLLSDKYNWIIAKKNKLYNPDNKRSSEFNHISFYSRLDNALQGLAECVLRQSNARSMSDIGKELKSFHDALSKVRQEISGIIDEKED